MVEQTKRLEAEMKAEEMKKQKLVNHHKELEEQKQLEGQMKFEALKAKLLAQKLENEKMEKQISDMQRISDPVIVTEETILTSNVPNCNE